MLLYNHGQLAAYLMKPKVFQKALINYVQKAGGTFSQSKTIMPIAEFDARVAAAGGNDFFTGASTLTNIDNFVPPESEHTIILGYRVFDGNDAVLADTDWLTGANSVFTKSGTMSILNNGIRVLKEYATSEALADLTTRDQGLLHLQEPITWWGQTDLEMNIDWASAPALNDNIKIQQLGIGFR